MGALTVAVVTRPFAFEGKRRMQQAERGLQELLEAVDTVIVIPNEKLLAVAKDAGFFESFRIADDVLRQGVQGISDIITIPGVINRDFADVKTTMAGMGYAVMGTAMGSGPNRAIDAAKAAIASPLLEAGAIDGARGILMNITGSSSLKLTEVNEASTIVQDAAHEDANIIFGAVLDESMGDDVKITVIATGFKQQQMPQRRERMLAEATLPTVRFDVPIQQRVPPPRIEAPRTETPRFASEPEQAVLPVTEFTEPGFTEQSFKEKGIREPGAREQGVKEHGKTGGENAQAELIPVSASVFDDDFFRHPEAIVEAPAEVERTEPHLPGRFRESTHFSGPGHVQPEDIRIVADAQFAGDSLVRGSSFGGAADHSEPDELDIPAFLRRGN